MKILVVEDERRTLEHITHAISNLSDKYEVIGSARNGTDGLHSALELKPDLVITDIKMPGMDGLEMIRALVKNHCTAKYIILSGYSDFSYAQEAIKLGSADYLLKPYTLNTLKASLHQVEQKLLEEKRIRSSLPSSYSTQQLLAFTLTLPEDSSQDYHAELELRLGAQDSYLLLLKSDHSFSADYRDGFYQLTNQLSEHHNIISCCAHLMENQRECLLLCTAADPEDTRQFTAALKHTLENRFLASFAFCLEPCPAANQIKGIYGRMKKMIYDIISFQDIDFISEVFLNQQDYASFLYPKEIENGILKKISSADPAEAEADLQRFCSYLKKARYKPCDLRAGLLRLSEAILFRIRTENYGIYEEFNYLETLNWIKSRLFLSSFCDIITGIIQQLKIFNDKLNYCDNEIVNGALEIIMKEFSSDLSLESVAERCYVTYEYLSSLFTKELGIKFTTWVTQYRMDRAKEMLAEGNLKIYEIAKRCGYDDVRYFCKVFRKYVGTSPSSYVRSLLK